MTKFCKMYCGSCSACIAATAEVEELEKAYATSDIDTGSPLADEESAEYFDHYIAGDR